MKPTVRWRRNLVSLALSGAGLVSAAAASEPKVEMTVQLPPFIVEHVAGPTWRYGEIPRFEILSRCDEWTTERLARSFHRANQLLGIVLPGRFQLALDTPHLLVFYDQRFWLAAEKEAAATLLRGKPAFPVVPLPGLPGSPEPTQFFDNLMLTDVDVIATFTIVSNRSFNFDATYLTADYVRNLLFSRTPALPPWLTAGFLRLYHRMRFQEHAIWLDARPWQFGERPPVSAKGISPEATVPPLADLFTDQALRTGNDVTSWLNHAELFVAWGIDPADPARVAAFWQFAELACSEGPTERSFQACFGFGFAEAARRMAFHAANARAIEWPFASKAAQLPDFDTRWATAGEIARIKGEWERLETRYVKKIRPELEAEYQALARRTLHKAYDREDRDPRLLATLGLLELEADNRTSAAELLEEAVKRGVARPRAGFELARLRYSYFFGRSTRNDGRFIPEQANAILEPLLPAARQAPPLPQVYELMAHVCAKSVEPPSTEVLDALDDCAKFFPGNADLLHKVAVLYSDLGHTDRARRVIQAGLRHGNDVRLIELEGKLNDVPAGTR